MCKAISQTSTRGQFHKPEVNFIRYGVQLYGKVRLTETECKESLLESLQITQNKFARFVHGSTLADRISTTTIFKDTKLLLVNQINAQIKVLEVWKSKNFQAYPIQWENRSDIIGKSGLKSSNKPDLIIRGKSKTQEQTFYNDAARVCNAAPNNIKDCKTIFTVKKHIKTFVQTLPV